MGLNFVFRMFQFSFGMKETQPFGILPCNFFSPTVSENARMKHPHSGHRPELSVFWNKRQPRSCKIACNRVYFSTTARRVTSPTWGPPPPCKQALIWTGGLPHLQSLRYHRNTLQQWPHTRNRMWFEIDINLCSWKCTSNQVYSWV